MALVWVDAWQQQCCGEPFGVGSTIRWSAVRVPAGREWSDAILDESVMTGLQYWQETHGDEECELTGTVRTIREITCGRRRWIDPLDGRESLHAIPGSGELRSIDLIDEWGPDLPSGRTFEGWLVDLDDTAEHPLPQPAEGR